MPERTRIVGLGFESEIFAAPVQRLLVPAAIEPGKFKADLDLALRAARKAGAALMSCRVPEHHAAASVLKDFGFEQVETLVTFERAVGPASDKPVAISFGGPADIEPSVEIARSAFHFDRFHADPRIADNIADRIKEHWVRNAFAGRADAVLVTYEAGRCVGFILCLLNQRAVVIDLIAVAPDRSENGHGSRLVESALAHYAGAASLMRVGTQESNAPSIAFYERLGFKVADKSWTYHWMP